MRTQKLFPIACVLLLAACATPRVTPVSVSPVNPGSGERVVVDHSFLIVDASESISRRDAFPGEKALAQSLVAAMPDGGYGAGSISYGGFRRETHPLSTFDRRALGAHASGLSHLSEGSPVYSALAEAGEALQGKRGHAAITVLSDGLPTTAGGREVADARSFEAARQAAEGFDGKLCLYTIQVGSDPAGAAFLQKLSQVTGCGSSRSAASLQTASAIQGFQREVYLGAAPMPVAKSTPGDRDGDGVLDPSDKCPGTPTGAKVDSRGCWVIQGLNFATNSAEIEPASRTRLQNEVVPVLRANRGVQIAIDGHTDSRGDAAYNQKLSERRAESVRAYLVSLGVSADRLTARGFGETRPIAPNDTAENLRKNRRTELTAVGQ